MRQLAAGATLLLAGEPTVRLDRATARRVGELLAELAAKTDTAIVCATHHSALIDYVRTRPALVGMMSSDRATGPGVANL